ncbi:rhizobactin siderophore biosynthesis protein RhsF [Skermanella mucosa]|uniref:IucA/IucC family protein n=1 Tax=Skermanella mucosa TaxID=1789672 RepID=UPI00192B2C94|nr:IucA/IucC family protein [Skermanella mucosa]UEM18548.1 rhizobactin siderophore biosynthesis protein RhsF [Skermanella mucosa]
MPLPRDLPGQADERVLRQLVAALLFERVLEARSAEVDGGPGFEWVSGGVRFRCEGTAGPFGRLRIVPGSVRMRVPGGQWEPADPRPLVEGLATPAAHKVSLLEELDRTVALCRWNDANLSRRTRRDMSFADLEGALEEGHPYHPCFKARLGFDEEDHAAYGPEAGRGFQLFWLLVERSHLHQDLGGDEEAFWRAELGGKVWEELDARRAAAGRSADRYGFLPVHPWQWSALRDRELASWLADGRACPLGPLGDRYRASQSVRTVMNVDDPRKADIKLAMNIVNTASRRIIVPHSVCTGPAIARWLTGVVESDPFFREDCPLTLRTEYAGIIADRDGPLAGQLAALWRRSVVEALRDGEAAIPFNMLMLVETDGRPFVADWVESFGLLPWLDRLLEIAVLPVWHLLVCHGIAVEAHGQNMVLVHRNGWPERLVLRDFHESVEYVPEFLKDREAVPDFPDLDPVYRGAPPDRYYWSDRVDALRELVMDTLFIYNLTEVSHLLNLHYCLPEPVFWRKVHDCLERYARRQGLEERHRRIGHAAREILTESLMRGKLLNATEELHHPVPNVFADNRG